MDVENLRDSISVPEAVDCRENEKWFKFSEYGIFHQKSTKHIPQMWNSTNIIVSVQMFMVLKAASCGLSAITTPNIYVWELYYVSDAFKYE